MNIALRLPVVAFACAALACASACAVPPPDPPGQQRPMTSTKQPGHGRWASKGHAHPSAGPVSPNRVRPLAKPPHPIVRDSAGAQHSGSRANMAARVDRPTSATRSAQASVPRNAVSSVKTIRHHSGNPPRVGGAKSSAADTAAVNGTHMGRTP